MTPNTGVILTEAFLLAIRSCQQMTSNRSQRYQAERATRRRLASLPAEARHRAAGRLMKWKFSCRCVACRLKRKGIVKIRRLRNRHRNPLSE
jgi:hypothetical protein